MTETVGVVDPRDAKIAELQAQLEEIHAAEAAKGSTWGKVKSQAKKIVAGVAAALSSPDAIKAEKSLAALVLTRVAVLVPTAAGIVLVIIKALGGPDTGVTP